MSDQLPHSATKENKQLKKSVVILLLLVIMVIGASFRVINVNWDESFHLHPDERFLSQVIAQIRPADSVSEYFNTESSALNPNTHGFTFFVYGTFPLFLIRYAGEWTGQTGYDLNTLLGRQLSAAADILTILLVFLIAFRLYNERAGLITAALYALAVFPIQQSHFMTVDTFTNTFGMLTVLAAVNILKLKTKPAEGDNRALLLWKRFWPYIFFGLALGMATASKINAVSLALLLPLVELVRIRQMDESERAGRTGVAVLNVVIAAVVSFLTFRVLQPYAFAGPGFFNFGINPDWWNGLRNLQQQSTGEVDFPPALQWIRRPVTFSLKNLLIWGVSLPWGITAVISWLAMGWKIFKRNELYHAPIWVWMLLYYLWQGTAWVSSMRYLLLLYPLMAVVAGWGLNFLLSNKQSFRVKRFKLTAGSITRIGIVLTALILVSTAAWAFAFTQIYTRPVTRVEATDWIYENLDGPVNLYIETETGEVKLPAQYRAYTTLVSGQSLPLTFSIQEAAHLVDLTYPDVQSIGSILETVEYELTILDAETNQPLHESPFTSSNPLAPDGNSRQSFLVFSFEQAMELKAGRRYQAVLTLVSPDSQSYLSGVPTANLYRNNGEMIQETLPKINEIINQLHPYSMRVSTLNTGSVTRVEIPYLLDNSLSAGQKSLRMTLTANNDSEVVSASSVVSGSFNTPGDGRGGRVVFNFDQPLEVTQAQDLELLLELQTGEGEIMVSTPGIALESSWDDGLPLPRPGMVPYDSGAGLFRGDLNFEMYWPDEASKRERLYQVLNQADYIIMSSNRQFGTIPRAPERYPMGTHFYRELIGCGENEDTLDCYYRAEEGQISSNLGFDLLKTFTSYPNLGSLEFNDQYAEEAFSVYDHPKVLIFSKNASYDPEHTWEVLNEVDLSQAVFLTPSQLDDLKEGDDLPQNQLLLSEEQLETQQEGGTWAEIFDRDALFNKRPWTGVVALYLFLMFLGWVVYPVVRLAFYGLRDKGYGFARIVGLLLFTLAAFNLGSVNVAITRASLIYCLLAIVVLSMIVAWFTRQKLLADIKENWKQFLVEELIFLVAFAFFLWIRYQNPDLWHPWRGGEKPMDFSYLNAVIKSSLFPAYDPWYAGGYINYYYYGQIIVALPIKLLGIIPSVAYNILLPLWYGMLFLGAFTVGWNLAWFVLKDKLDNDKKIFGWAFWAGIASALLLAFIGNLGEIKVISDGLAALGSGGADITQVNLSQKLVWIIKGISLSAQGMELPIGAGTWYWNPSRTIPGEPITEFPFFTFLYADFHAHLIAMPIVMAAVGWGLSLLMVKQGWQQLARRIWWVVIPAFFIGAMVIGALQPTNTWDFLTFAVFNLIIVFYVGWKDFPALTNAKIPRWLRKFAIPLAASAALLVFSRLLYANFSNNFFPGYSSVGFWQGPKTPVASYLLHWGLILFLIASWFGWELYHWMANTRMSALQPWRKYKQVIIGAGIGILVVLFGLLLLKVSIAIIAVPLASLALFLILTTQNDGKRLAYFMIGTGLLLTIVVELVYLVGDIGRMNVVFKLYHQAWMLLTLPLGLAVVILFSELRSWKTRNQVLFQVPLALLVFIGLLFPLLASKDKILDRMDANAPKTLDGMKYMETSSYQMNGVDMNLGQDYRAIKWMQDNVSGSPVIMEAQAYEYGWGNRYTIYTGLPGVVGWNYHQRQQRAILANNDVWSRVEEVNAFYQSVDKSFVTDILDRYDVEYIVVGQLEFAMYSFEGLSKFEEWNGELWDEVYREASTVIYKVR